MSLSRKEEHHKYINSPIWKRKRAEAYAHHGRACAACGSTEDLQMHHISYLNLSRKGPGKEKMEDLIPLCGHHHDLVHKLIKQYKEEFNKNKPYYNFEKASKEAIEAIVPKKYLKKKAYKDKNVRKKKRQEIKKLNRGIGCAKGSNLKFTPNKKAKRKSR